MEEQRRDQAGDVQILPLDTRHDELLLWDMLHLAALARDEDGDLRQDPDLARYVDGWGRAGDRGVKAVDPGRASPVGAAWLRLWRADDHGYGYIDEHTPEIAVAVAATHRGRNIGTRLLEALIRTEIGSHAALSLSVRRDNPARRLYRRLGFEELAGSRTTNRAGDTSVTMRLDLTGGMTGRVPRRWEAT